MPAILRLSQSIQIGTPIVLPCPSPLTSHAVVFEDDGETGALYGMDRSLDFHVPAPPEIYTVDDIENRDREALLEVIWSEDGLKAVLCVDEDPEAVFDFEAKRAYCRSGLPEPHPAYTDTHEWADGALEHFL